MKYWKKAGYFFISSSFDTCRFTEGQILYNMFFVKSKMFFENLQSLQKFDTMPKLTWKEKQMQ